MKKADLRDYNRYEIKAGLEREATNKMIDDPVAYERRRLENAGRNLELEEMEEHLGIDGAIPSERGKFKSVGVVGTTAYSAFKPATLRVLQDGEYGQNR